MAGFPKPYPLRACRGLVARYTAMIRLDSRRAILLLIVFTLGCRESHAPVANPGPSPQPIDERTDTSSRDAFDYDEFADLRGLDEDAELRAIDEKIEERTRLGENRAV